MIKLGLIGPGKLGVAITRLFLEAQQIQLEYLVAPNLKKARSAISALEKSLDVRLSTKLLGEIRQITATDIILLTTQDDVLIQTAEQLAKDVDLSKCQQILFCSGSIESEAIAEAIQHCAPVMGVHPMMSFSTKRLTLEAFQGTICTYEGEEGNPNSVLDLFRAVGGKMVPVNSKAKLQYHLGTVVACNYLNALRMIAEDHLTMAGLDADDVHAGLSKLMGQTLENIDSKGAIGALTGPVARGDGGLIERQLAILECDERQHRIYKDLAFTLLEKLEHNGQHVEEGARLRALLDIGLITGR